MEKSKLSILAGVGLLALSGTANAAWVAFTDNAAWNDGLTALGINLNPVLETFDPVPGQTQIDHTIPTTTPNGLFDIFYTTEGGINETKNKFENGQLKLQFDTTNDKQTISSGDPVNATPGDKTTALEFQFDGSYSAFSADFFQVGRNHGLTLILGDEKYKLRDLFEDHADGFFGLIGSEGETFDSLSFFADSSENFIVDDLSVGSFATVPIPGAIWLMGTALMLMTGMTRQKKLSDRA